MKCVICFYEWNPKIRRPKECPNCKTRNYWGDKSCYICENERQLIHHINGNQNDNSTKNLLPLCNKCHHRIHHPPKNDLGEWKISEQERMLLEKFTNLYFESNNKKNKGLNNIII